MQHCNYNNHETPVGSIEYKGEKSRAPSIRVLNPRIYKHALRLIIFARSLGSLFNCRCRVPDQLNLCSETSGGIGQQDKSGARREGERAWGFPWLTPGGIKKKKKNSRC